MRSYADVAQLVAHHLAKVDVASSSLVSRSIPRSSNGRTTVFEAVNHSSSLCLGAFVLHYADERSR